MILLLAVVHLLTATVEADICAHCDCQVALRSVECTSPTLLVRTVSLLPLMERLSFEGVHLPTAPTFLYHPTLRTLRLSRCQLENITSTALLAYPQLQILDLSNNRLESIPYDLIRHLKNLRVLNLASNRISDLSQIAVQLAEGLVLEQLDLSDNALILSSRSVSLPPSRQIFLSNSNLERLAADRLVFSASTTCPLEEDCRSLKIRNIQMEVLESLDIGCNDGLIVDDDALEVLANLTTLDASSSRLPSQFYSWLSGRSDSDSGSSGLSNRRIRQLNVSGAHILLPNASWNYCGRLESLDVSHLGLRSLQLSPSCNLSTLYARHNQLFTLAVPQALKSLFVDENELSEWPFATVGSQIFQLHHLSMQRNRLKTLPPESLRSLPSLEVLDLSHNRLDTLGAFETVHMRLVSLELAHNALTSFPVCVLPSLLLLDISNNELVYIDNAVFADLPSLQHLSIANNSAVFMECDVGERCWSDSLDELTNLSDLDLSGTALSRSLPLSKSPSLRRINLRNNNLVRLDGSNYPEVLQMLDVGENSIRTVANISLLPDLEVLRLDQNPLRCECSLREVAPFLLKRLDVRDPTMYYCYNDAWELPLLPYLATVHSCRSTSRSFLSLFVTTSVIGITLLCLLLLILLLFKRYNFDIKRRYRRLATEWPAASL